MIVMDELYTIEEVARILRYTEYTVREMCKRGELKAKKIGRSWRIRPEDLRELVEKQEDKK